ncbi:MAG: hypothetical protein MUF62_07010 [Chitinophagaceae bacterium]|jgi:hypothetical protein|nr:hypothetical protein [Chitinophagaceae bacterium]
MKRPTCILLITACLAVQVAAAQTTTAAGAKRSLQVQPERSWPDTLTDFEVDNLGNLYLISQQQQIKKLDNRYDSIATFNEVRSFGSLHSVDVSNPLRIILWYKDQGTLLLLDRFMNRRSTLDLRQAGILQCNAIGQSFDNNIWVYDDLMARVIKIDEAGSIIQESPDLRILYEQPPHPHKLEDFNRQLYAYDSLSGLLLFDYFGAVQKRLPYKGWQQIQGHGRGILAVGNGQISFLHSNGIDSNEWLLPTAWTNIRKIRFFQQKVYVLMGQRLFSYRLLESLE